MAHNKCCMTKYLLISFLLISTIFTTALNAQAKTPTEESKTLSKLVLKENGVLLGYILDTTATSIYFETNDGRKIYVPKEAVQEIVNAEKQEKRNNFTTALAVYSRYFTTSSAIPVPKGKHTLEAFLPGVRMQFSLPYNITINTGVSFALNPLYINVKKSFKLSDRWYLAPSVSYLQTTYGLFSTDFNNVYFVAPILSLSYLGRHGSITVNGGYLIPSVSTFNLDIFSTSLAFQVKVSKKASVIFDSFVPIGLSLNVGNRLIPGLMVQSGIRLYASERNAYQFEITVLPLLNLFDGRATYLPIPNVRWIHSI